MKYFSVVFIVTSTVFVNSSFCIPLGGDILFYNITVLVEENVNNTVSFDIISVNIYNLGNELRTTYTGLTIRQQPIYDIHQGAVGNLPWIKYVSFEDDEIDSIATGAFFNLPSLKVLSITGNQLLRNITDGVFNCSNLIELYLYNNSIEYVSSHAFAGVAELQVLGLDMNKIKRINYKWFVPTKYLFIIFLNYNKLSKIRRKDLRSLQRTFYNDLKLHFAYNKVRNLEEGVFRDMFINDLNLSNNNLETVNFHIFGEAGKVRHVSLTGNNIVCSDRRQLIALFSSVESITKTDGWDDSCIPITI